MRCSQAPARTCASSTSLLLVLALGVANMAAGVNPRQKRAGVPASSCNGNRLYKNPYRDIRVDVFDSYVPALPSIDGPLVVTINLQLVALVDVNEPEETTVINAWLMVYWKDEALRWNPENYSNISVAEYPSTSRLWVPDIAWYERIPMVEAYEYDEGLFNGARAVINSNGDLYISRGLLMRSHCKLQVQRFPFDTQQCNFTFQSTVHNTNRLVLQPYANRVWRPENTEGWIVLGFPAYSTNKTYPEVGSFSRVIFSLKIKRKPLFYIFYLMLPNFLISVLGSFVFLMPPDSSEKVTFCVSILLSLTIFMMIMLGLTPPSESVPIISMYFFLVLLTCMANAAVTIIIQCLNSKKQKHDCAKACNQVSANNSNENDNNNNKDIKEAAEATPLSPTYQPTLQSDMPDEQQSVIVRKISPRTAHRVSRICFVFSLTFSLVVPTGFLLYGKYGGD